MGCKVALPSCTWETSAFPKWLSTGHLALWAPLRGLQCLGGATDRIWPSRAKTTETGQSAPCLGLSFPTCEMGQFLMLLWAPYFSNSPVQN